FHRAQWVDEPCHRSALAGPARAAITIEQSDPHSSVTFISFACSGAAIPNLITSSQRKGSRRMPPQLDKVFEAAGDRTIDALLVSVGGNDLHFSLLVFNTVRLRHAETDRASNKTVHDGIVLLPSLFAAMAQRLKDPNNKAKVANVFISQYPDIVRDESRDLCDHSTPINELLNAISGAESEWALNTVIIPLNTVIQKQAATWGWNYVDGILSKFGGDSTDHVAHGFCADDKRWVNTFNDSWRIQGDKNGTVHPNSEGHAWCAQRLVEELQTKGVTAPPTP
ncbi:MAG: GDSL-type esterase/lipase family protein, partial [Pyrinomonadaceae bacterium]